MRGISCECMKPSPGGGGKGAFSSDQTPQKKEGGKKYTYILQHLDLGRQNAHLLLILTLQLIQHRRAILPSRIRCRAPVVSSSSSYSSSTTTAYYTAASKATRPSSGIGAKRQRRASARRAVPVRRTRCFGLGLGGGGAAVVGAEEVVAVAVAVAAVWTTESNRHGRLG